jgi:hypothetical protein
MEDINAVIKQLVGIGLALIPLAVVLFLLVGGPLPFFGAVVDNLINFIKALGDGGPVGFLVAAFIVWLFACWALPGTGFAGPDDLKRISGVGPAIESKLNAMGVTYYQEIANWSAADIQRIDDELNFRGRIAREDWVGQAKILAAGGETAFSQRYES